MKYRVIKGFNDVDGWKNPGDVIEVDGWRETKLRQARLIGAVVETATEEPDEAAVIEPETNETATAKKGKEKRG